jgi:hypothetical protein
MSTILEHPLWPLLRTMIRIEVYGRDGGPDRPRWRLEVDPPTPAAGRVLLLVTMPCVSCGATISPIRQRAARTRDRGHFYFAPTCPLSVSLGCSRGRAAHAEYERVKLDVEQAQQQLVLEGMF